MDDKSGIRKPHRAMSKAQIDSLQTIGEMSEDICSGEDTCESSEGERDTPETQTERSPVDLYQQSFNRTQSEAPFSVVGGLAMGMQLSTDVLERKAHVIGNSVCLSERKKRQSLSTKIFTDPYYRGIIVQDSSNVNLSIGAQRAGTMDPGILEIKIQDIHEVFVETATYHRVEETLKKHGHATITGASGEGKTSIALMLGDKYRSQGYQLVFVDDVDKYRLSLSTNEKLFFIFDDIFGSVGLSTDISHLKKILSDLEACLKKNKILTRHKKSHGKLAAKYSECQLLVVFTTNTYNLTSAITKLDGQEFYFFKGTTVMDLTRKPDYRYSFAEKKQIYQKHMKCHDTDNAPDIEDICNFKNNIFGFPLICSLFCKFSSFQKDPVHFFLQPLSYLKGELKQILQLGNNKSAIFVLMLLCEDSLNLNQLEMESENKILESTLREVSSIVQGLSRTEMAREARNFRGTFFTEGDCIRFSYSAVYDACACALYNINPTFVLKHCSIKFLYERVQPQLVPSTSIDDHLHIIYVSQEYYDIIAARLAEAIREGKFSMSIAHPILQREEVVDRLFVILGLKPNADENMESLSQDVFHLKEKDRCFLYWAVHAHSLYLVTELLKLVSPVSPQEIKFLKHVHPVEIFP